jgi:hypothetical protein
MNGDDEIRIEAAITAHRESSGEVHFHPAFHDLDAAGRERLWTATWRQRRLEQALAADGMSTTARAVLARLRRG